MLSRAGDSSAMCFGSPMGLPVIHSNTRPSSQRLRLPLLPVLLPLIFLASCEVGGILFTDGKAQVRGLIKKLAYVMQLVLSGNSGSQTCVLKSCAPVPEPVIVPPS